MRGLAPTPTGARATQQGLKVASILNSLSAFPTAHLEPLPHLEYSGPGAYYEESVDYSMAGSSPTTSSFSRVPTTTSSSGDSHGHSANGSSTTKVSARMVGRGGVGSKPRSIASTPSITHFHNKSPAPPLTRADSGSSPTQNNDAEGKIRFVGRGGVGSKKRVVKDEKAKAPATTTPITRSVSAMTAPARTGPPTTQEVAPKRVVRVAGRGGAGSRPRVMSESGGGPPAPLTLKVPWKKGKKDKKQKRRELSPEYHQLQRRRSRDSVASVETIKSKPRESFDSVDDISIEGAAPQRQLPRSAGNLNKLAKTMGELPPHLIYQQLMNKRHPPHLAKLDARVHGRSSSSPVNSPSSGAPFSNQGRAGKSISQPHSTQSHYQNQASSSSTSILPDYVYPSGHPSRLTTLPEQTTLAITSTQPRRGSIASDAAYTTTSSLSDLHRFGLQDEMSESWGEVRDSGSSARDSVSTWSYRDGHSLRQHSRPDSCLRDDLCSHGDDRDAPSPIMFSPPSPAPAKLTVEGKKKKRRDSWLSVMSTVSFSSTTSDASSVMGGGSSSALSSLTRLGKIAGSSRPASSSSVTSSVQSSSDGTPPGADSGTQVTDRSHRHAMVIDAAQGSGASATTASGSSAATDAGGEHDECEPCTPIVERSHPSFHPIHDPSIPTPTSPSSTASSITSSRASDLLFISRPSTSNSAATTGESSTSSYFPSPHPAQDPSTTGLSTSANLTSTHRYQNTEYLTPSELHHTARPDSISRPFDGYAITPDPSNEDPVKRPGTPAVGYTRNGVFQTSVMYDPGRSPGRLVRRQGRKLSISKSRKVGGDSATQWESVGVSSGVGEEGTQVEWSGQWNTTMPDVIRALRML